MNKDRKVLAQQMSKINAFSYLLDSIKFHNITNVNYNSMSVTNSVQNSHSAQSLCSPPFGMQMENRSYACSIKGYRVAFNGKEKDDEGMGGGGSTYDYGFRIYNPALGKFLSVDPLSKSYPWYTPYQFAGNMPVIAIDLDGLEPDFMIDKQGRLTRPMITLLNCTYGFSEKVLRKTKWKGTNFERVQAMTIFRTVYWSYTSLYTYYQVFPDQAKYENDWCNIIAHEQEHRNEIGNGLMGAVKWYVDYAIGYALAGFDYRSNKFEDRAFDVEPLMTRLITYRSGSILDVLKSDKTDSEKSLEIGYLVNAFFIEETENKIQNLKNQLNNKDNTNKESRMLEKSLKKNNDVLSDLLSDAVSIDMERNILELPTNPDYYQ